MISVFRIQADFIVFCVIMLFTFIRRRFWCRYLCPLGGMLAVFARFSPLKRVVIHAGKAAAPVSACAG